MNDDGDPWMMMMVLWYNNNLYNYLDPVTGALYIPLEMLL